MTSDSPYPAGPAMASPPGNVLSTMQADGARLWLKPRLATGRLYRARRALAYALIAFFVVLPYLRWHGEPLVLLDLVHRRFTIFGYTFLPTDTLLLALALVGGLLTIFLLTALLGRVWCGWACPQTVYLEFVYRPIERLFDGTLGRGGKPDAPPTGWRVPAKYLLYFIISFLVGNTFLAYFVGTDQLWQWVHQSPAAHPAAFVVMLVVTGAMMFNFSYFREQLCIIACPYGRLQSVLLDRQSLVVSYDRRRGEPRTKYRKSYAPDAATGQARPRGDCIDCGRCVRTCPTGIDIREGLQMECVNCTQCIDTCNAVMAQIGRAPGLIRYASQAEIEGEPRRWLRPRVILYPAILALIGVLWLVIFVGKPAADVVVLRTLGNPFTVLPDGAVAGGLRLKLVNRTRADNRYEVSVAAGPAVKLEGSENPVAVPAAGSRTVGFMVLAPASAFTAGVLPLTISVTDAAGVKQQVPYRLLGPSGSVKP